MEESGNEPGSGRAVNTLDKLRRIPDLAAEAWMTWDAPNPGPRAEHHGRTKTAHPPAPTNLGTLVALTVPTDRQIDDGTPTGSLLLELLLAVRHLVEDRDGMPDWPDHTWTGVCAWLTVTAPHWGADPFSADWVGDAVAHVHRRLEDLCRIPRDAVYRCSEPGCGNPARADGEWIVCDAGHHIPRAVAMRRAIAGRPLMTAREIAAQPWGVPEGTLRRWKHLGLVRPVGRVRAASGQTVDLWEVWQVIEQQHAARNA